MVTFPLNKIGDFVVIPNAATALVRHLERHVVEPKGLTDKLISEQGIMIFDF